MDNVQASIVGSNEAQHATEISTVTTTTTEFQGMENSVFWSTIALALWLGAIHINIAIVVVALFFFPAWLSAMVFAALVLFAVIPFDHNSSFGMKLARFICKYACGYFPITVHVENIHALDPNQAYVLGFEPHSVMAIGTFALVNHSAFLPLTKIKILAHSAILRTPFMRQVWTWLGSTPVTKTNFYRCLEEGYSCILVPGGVRECDFLDHNSEVVYLKERKGFVAIAVTVGRPIVPVFCFGQRHVYHWWKPRSKLFIRFFKMLKLPSIIYWGRFGSPIPFRHPMHIVVGRPIELTKNPNPTVEEVNEVHAKYIEAMQELYEKYKMKVGCPNLGLQII